MAPENWGSDINQSEPRLRRWLAHNLVPLCVWDRGVDGAASVPRIATTSGLPKRVVTSRTVD